MLCALSLPAIVLNSSSALHTADTPLSGLSATTLRTLYRRYEEADSFTLPSGHTLSVSSALHLYAALDLTSILVALLLYAIAYSWVDTARRQGEDAAPSIARYSVYLPTVPAVTTEQSLVDWTCDVIAWSHTGRGGGDKEDGHVAGPAAQIKLVEACLIDNYSDVYRFGEERCGLLAQLHLTEHRSRMIQAGKLSFMDEVIGCFDGPALELERQDILQRVQDIEDRLLEMQAALRLPRAASSSASLRQAVCAFLSFHRAEHRDRFLHCMAERGLAGTRYGRSAVPPPRLHGSVPVVLPADPPSSLRWSNLHIRPWQRWWKERRSDFLALCLLLLSFIPTFFASWQAAEYSRGLSPERCLARGTLAFLARWSTFHTQAEVDGWQGSTAGAGDTRLFCLCELQPWASLRTLSAVVSHPWSAACPTQTCTRLLAVDPVHAMTAPSCTSLLDRRETALLYVTGASVVVTAVNYLLCTLLPYLSRREGHASLGMLSLSLSRRLCALLTVNTLLLPVLVNVAWPGLSYDGSRFAIGQYADMVPAWYDIVGTQVMITVMLHAAAAIVRFMLSNIGAATCKALGKEDDSTGLASDRDSTIEWAVLYGELSFLACVTCIPSAGMPLLLPVGLGTMLLVWTTHAYRQNRRPQREKASQVVVSIQVQLAQQSVSFLPTAIALHLAAGSWMLGSVQSLSRTQQDNSPQALLQEWAGAHFTGTSNTSSLLPGVPARIGLGGVLVDVPVMDTLTGVTTPFRFFAAGVGGFNDTSSLESFYSSVLPSLWRHPLSFVDTVLSPVGASYSMLLVLVLGCMVVGRMHVHRRVGTWWASCVERVSSLPESRLPVPSLLELRQAGVGSSKQGEDVANEPLTYNPLLQPSIQRNLCIEPRLLGLCSSLPELVMTKDV